MDNRYRRDHELPYMADGSMAKEMEQNKRAVREYNTVMPFDPEKGMECLKRTGIKHGKNVYFEPPFHCEYGTHIELGEAPRFAPAFRKRSAATFFPENPDPDGHSRLPESDTGCCSAN